MVNRSQEGTLYRTFGELLGKGFSLDWGTFVFLVGVHTAAIALFIWLFFAAPAEWARYAAIWAAVHCLLGSFSTTVYTHRLILITLRRVFPRPSMPFSVSLARFLAFRVVFVIGQQITRCITA